jgi:hypothetical protein
MKLDKSKSFADKKCLSRKQKIIITVLVLALLGILSFFFMCSASAYNSYRGIGRQTLVKSWSGDVGTVSNVYIQDDNGTIFWNGALPADDTVTVPGINFGDTVIISWNDWQGFHSEDVIVNNASGTTELFNYIPTPAPETLVKSWTGDVGSVSNVYIEDFTNGTSLYSGGLPADDTITIPGINFGNTVYVSWNDRQGFHSEYVIVNNASGTTELSNYVPTPPLDNAPGNLI